MTFFFVLALTGRIESNASNAQHSCLGSVRCFRVRAGQSGNGRRREADCKTFVVRGHGGARTRVLDGSDHCSQRFRSGIRES